MLIPQKLTAAHYKSNVVNDIISKQKVPFKASIAVLQTLNGGKLLNMAKAVAELGMKSANVCDET